ncbi:MAG TPA: hypothetical protein VGJ28_19370 [Micromonosporaceae bacterium]|jgi:hypothetical protein
MFTHTSVPLLAGAALLTATFTARSVLAYARRDRTDPATPSASVFAAAGLATVAGVITVAVAPAVTAPVLTGRPAVWLAVQAAALVTVIAAGMTAHTYVRALVARSPGMDRLDFGLLAVASGVFVPWAVYAGLLLP